MKKTLFWGHSFITSCILVTLTYLFLFVWHDNYSNARLVCSKSKEGLNSALVEVESWPIEDIWWYFGCEPKRQPPFHFNITFIPRDDGQRMERTKDRPFFGNTISFEYRELFAKWVAAMLVAEHSSDIKPPPQLLLLD